MNILRIDSLKVGRVAHLFDQYRVFYGLPSDPDLAREWLQTRLDNRESVVFAALSTQGEKVIAVGFAQLYPSYSSLQACKNWILNDLYVEPGHRGQGIGRMLVATVIDFSDLEGARFMELETAADNFIAQGLYESAGFIKQSPAQDFCKYRLTLKTK